MVARRETSGTGNSTHARIGSCAKKMPSTHVSLHSHLIFSTKERIPLIVTEWRTRLHSYLGGIVNGLGGVPLAIGGTVDHVHLLVGIRSSHRLDYFLRDLEADSSEWIHREIGKPSFAWQKGYGAFSVSPSHLQAVGSTSRIRKLIIAAILFKKSTWKY